MTPSRYLLFARLGFGALCLTATALMLVKSFQGLEAVFGLNDKAAHALAFYGLSLSLFAVAPRSRRQDLCLLAVAAALLIEVLQHFTGRSMSIGDFLAGTGGVAAAWAPGKAEDIRRFFRGESDLRATNKVQSEGMPSIGQARSSRAA